MKLTDQLGELFHLPSELELEIEATNPFLSEKGTLSLPVTLPASGHNFNIISNPERIPKSAKIEKKRNITIQEGIFCKSGTMEIFSIDKKEGITVSLYLNESSLYNRMKEVKLPDIFSHILRDDFTGTQEEKVIKWLDHLTQVMVGAVDDDFFLFPVRTKVTRLEGEGVEVINKYRALYNTESLNCLDSDISEIEMSNLPVHNGKKYYKLLAYKEQKTIDNETEISLPVGYGVTPFIKVNYVLKKIFEHFGYTLKPSILDTNISFLKMCLLNNVADTILKGTIDYRQLVPNVSLSDFLDSFRFRFNCEFYIGAESNTIELQFWNDIQAKVPDEDYTPYLDGSYIVEFANPKTVKLTSNGGNEYNNSKYSSYQELIKKFGTITTIPQRARNGEQGLYFVRADNAYFNYSIPGNTGIWPLETRNILDWFDAESESHEERKSPDERVAMLFCPFWDTTLPRGGQTIEVPAPFVGEVRHLNTAIRYNSDESASDSVPEKESEEGDCPIMYAFSIGRLKPTLMIPGSSLEYFFGGSTSKYMNDGSSWGEFSLAWDDLYHLFYAGFDEVLKTSFLTVTAKINLPEEKIMSLRMDRQKLLNNQPVLVESIKYVVANNRIEITEMKFRTMKTYG